MPVQPLPKQARISRRRQRQERGAKTCRERRARGGNTPFCAGKLGGITREEPVEGLVTAEPGDRWQDTERIRGEEQDFRRVPSCPTRLGIEKGERIGRPGILGQGVVVESRTSRVRVEYNILEDGSELLCRVEDFRFCLRG